MKAEHEWLIEILLPLAYNDGARIDDKTLSRIREDLIGRYGGLTAFTRSPAEGIWTSPAGAARDDIVVLEVMTDELDRAWWAAWRKSIEELLQQASIVVRATRMQRL